MKFLKHFFIIFFLLTFSFTSLVLGLLYQKPAYIISPALQIIVPVLNGTYTAKDGEGEIHVPSFENKRILLRGFKTKLNLKSLNEKQLMLRGFNIKEITILPHKKEHQLKKGMLHKRLNYIIAQKILSYLSEWTVEIKDSKLEQFHIEKGTKERFDISLTGSILFKNNTFQEINISLNTLNDIKTSIKLGGTFSLGSNYLSLLIDLNDADGTLATLLHEDLKKTPLSIKATIEGTPSNATGKIWGHVHNFGKLILGLKFTSDDKEILKATGNWISKVDPAFSGHFHFNGAFTKKTNSLSIKDLSYDSKAFSLQSNAIANLKNNTGQGKTLLTIIDLSRVSKKLSGSAKVRLNLQKESKKIGFQVNGKSQGIGIQGTKIERPFAQIEGSFENNRVSISKFDGGVREVLRKNFIWPLPIKLSFEGNFDLKPYKFSSNILQVQSGEACLLLRDIKATKENLTATVSTNGIKIEDYIKDKSIRGEIDSTGDLFLQFRKRGVEFNTQIHAQHLKFKDSILQDIVGKEGTINFSIKRTPSHLLSYSTQGQFKNLTLKSAGSLKPKNNFMNSLTDIEIPEPNKIKNLHKFAHTDKIKSQIHINGPLKNPSLNLTLASNNVTIASTSIKGIQLFIKIPSLKMGKAKLTFQSNIEERPLQLNSSFNVHKPLSLLDINGSFHGLTIKGNFRKPSDKWKLKAELLPKDQKPPKFFKKGEFHLLATGENGILDNLNVEGTLKNIYFKKLKINSSKLNIKAKGSKEFSIKLNAENMEIDGKKGQLTFNAEKALSKEGLFHGNFYNILKKTSDFSIKGHFDTPETKGFKAYGIQFMEGNKEISEISPISFQYNNGVFHLPEFTVKIKEGTLKSGLTLTAQEILFTLDAASWKIEELLRLTPYKYLRGEINGSLKIHGPHKHPIINGNLKLSDFHGVDRFIPVGEKASFNLTIHQNKNPLELDLKLTDSKGTNLSSKAKFSELTKTSLKLHPLSYFIEGKVNLSPLAQTFLADGSQLTGFLKTSFYIDPNQLKKSNGTIQLIDASYQNSLIGIYIKNVDLKGVLQGQKLKILKIQATDKSSGSLQGTGTLDFTNIKEPEFNISLNIKKFLIVDNGEIYLIISGPLSFEHAPAKNILTGNLTGDALKLSLRLIHSSVPKPIKVIDSATGKPLNFATKPDFYFDIQANLPKSADVSGYGLHSEWRGSAHLKGHSSHPTIHGSLHALDGGYISAFAKRFKLIKGIINFDGDPSTDTNVDLIGQFERFNSLILFNVQGAPGSFAISFQSDPYFPPNQVMSLLGQGNYSGEIDPIQALLTLDSADAFIKGDPEGGILNYIEKFTGISTITFGEQRDPRNFRYYHIVSIGKYLGPSVYLDAFHWSREGETGTRLMYSPHPNISLGPILGTHGYTGGALTAFWSF